VESSTWRREREEGHAENGCRALVLHPCEPRLKMCDVYGSPVGDEFCRYSGV
jgi:hypothetical protein